MKKTILTLMITVLLIIGGLQGLNAQANESGSGNCLSFDGVNDKVNFPSTVDLGNQDQFTIELWLKLNDNSTTQYLFTQANTANNVQLLTIETIGTALDFHFRDDANNLAVLQSISNPQTGVWHHVAAVRLASNSFELYLNGKLQDTDNTAIGAATFNTFHLGVLDRLLGETGWYNGQLDELRIWSKVLTQTEIRNNMTRKLTGNEAGLMGYWRMDNGSGTTIFDSSPGGNNGTLF